MHCTFFCKKICLFAKNKKNKRFSYSNSYVKFQAECIWKTFYLNWKKMAPQLRALQDTIRKSKRMHINGFALSRNLNISKYFCIRCPSNIKCSDIFAFNHKTEDHFISALCVREMRREIEVTRKSRRYPTSISEHWSKYLNVGDDFRKVWQ